PASAWPPRRSPAAAPTGIRPAAGRRGPARGARPTIPLPWSRIGSVAVTPRAPATPQTTGVRPPSTFALDEHNLVRSVNGLAIPIIAENLFQTMLGVVDLAMVGTLGAVAIAGT